MFYCTPKGTLTAWKNLGKTCKKNKTLEKPGKTKTNFETTCKKTKQPWKNLGTQKNMETPWNNLQKPWKKHGKTKKKWNNKKKQKKTKKNKNNTKNNISRLFGGGCPSQDSLRIVFFGFSNVFFVLVTFSHLHLFVHWPFGVFMRSSLQEPIV